MKHVTYGEKTLLVNEDIADALVEYARVIADQQGSDTVTVPGIASDGNRTEATFLLQPGIALVAETGDEELLMKVDPGVVEELRDRIDKVRNPPTAQPTDAWTTEESWAADDV